MKKTILFLWAFVMLLSISTKAQTLSPKVISSSGGFYSGGNATLSFTVAEMTMIQTFTQPSNILTQGFQQPEQLTTSISENNMAHGEDVIYPNPSNGQFNISYNANKEGEYLVSIYNMVGQEIFTQSYGASAGLNYISIDVSRYSQGLYILELSSVTVNGKKSSSIHKINLIY
jgi:hypothetical protein